MKKPLSERQEFTTEKAARAAAVATASGVLVCGVCCVLPIAIPAITFAGTGSVIAWLGGAQGWATKMAALRVVRHRQSRRLQRPVRQGSIHRCFAIEARTPCHRGGWNGVS
jgi:poly(3-hydroxybutyrate) depolymerase